ncbi:ABC transporter ATP-binding protein [Halostreptopolyspora alba]|uniref:ABC transporter ATP-binding protein n=1 Tax=Halostreptopolyspora alba TaxID=2487137 RepID=A0A3N0EG82_9ACTN|nr:ABC transporter ATP-binding protein [Nocardiopsaceae bacterium YIM 96095]
MSDPAKATVKTPASQPREHGVIEVSDLVVRYGAATALQGVSLSVGAGEMVALVGPNGAGKSTLVDTLSRVVRPASGHARVKGRLAHVPEGRQLFGELSVEDNLRIGAWGQRDRDPEPVYEVLPDLRDFARRKAAALSGGQQQMVAIGRALMARPDVIAVDELSLGLAPKVVSDLAAHLRTLNSERGMAVLLIEQNARLAFELCSRAYVLEAGRMVVSGSCEELARSNEVARAYLGGGTGDEL